MKKYVYFIVYATQKGKFGNLEVIKAEKITEISKIKDVEKHIEDGVDDRVTIINFKLLRVEN